MVFALFMLVLIALAILAAIIVWRAIHVQRRELYETRCKRCLFPAAIPLSFGQRCTECGTVLWEDSVHKPGAGPGCVEPLARAEGWLLALFLLVSVLLYMAAPLVVPTGVWTSARCSEIVWRPAFPGTLRTLPLYVFTIEIDYRGLRGGPPSSGTGMLHLRREEGPFLAVTFDVSTGAVTSSDVESIAIGTNLDSALVEALFRSTGLDLSDPQIRGDVDLLAVHAPTAVRDPSTIGNWSRPAAHLVRGGGSSSSSSYEVFWIGPVHVARALVLLLMLIAAVWSYWATRPWFQRTYRAAREAEARQRIALSSEPDAVASSSSPQC